MRIQDVYDAQGALAYVEANDPSNAMPYIGAAFFPARKQVGIDLKWIKGRKGVGVALKPSNFDALSTIRARKGFTFTKTEMPFFRESMIVKEQDEMDIMRVQQMNDPLLNQVLTNIYDDVAELTTGADIVAEQMRMQLLSANGGNMGIAIETNDQKYVYDYDPDGAWKETHYVEITNAADKWGTATAKPLTNINTGKEYLASIGVVAQYVLLTTATYLKMLSADEIKNAMITISGMPVAFLDREALDAVFARKTGLIPILYDKQYGDYDGLSKKFFPDDYATIIGAGKLGDTVYGTTPEERTLMGDSKVDVAVKGQGVAIAVQTLYGPPVQTKTTVSEIVLPSFEGMDNIYVMKVA